MRHNEKNKKKDGKENTLFATQRWVNERKWDLLKLQ